MNKPSGWLQAVCIMAIVLGSLGILTSLGGLAMLAAKGALQFGQPQPFGASEEQADAHRQMQRQLDELATRWRPITMPLMAAEILASACLIAGGIASLRLRPRGRTFLVVAFWAAIVLELVQLVPNIALQIKTSAVTTEFASRALDASGDPDQAMPRELRSTVTVITQVAAIGGILAVVIAALVQVVLYAAGAIYLRRPDVRERFEPVTVELLNYP